MPLSQRFLVGPYKAGLEKDVKPWLLPEDAFETLDNAYVWRGRVRKRLGSALLIGQAAPAANPQLISRLRINIGTTDGGGNLAGNVPGVVYKVGQMFSVAQEIFTVSAAGAPAAMLSTGAGAGTYNTTTGAYTIVGAAAATTVYFYPAEPVMGFAILETTVINFERYIAYDTQFAYEYLAPGGWDRLALGTATWTGTNSQFFYSAMYRGTVADDFLLFTSNNTDSVAGDGIRYFDGTTWNQFTQSYSTAANTLILGCRLIVQFKGRLVLLNTIEQPGAATVNRFQNRARFSQVGNPLQADAWHNPPRRYGKGGFIDAATQEEIISAQILRDRLIVYFERSTWELVYTGNEIIPFLWQNINIELGSESTFSLIPFDKGILGVGEVGIHTCNGVNVERIDNKIPDDIYDIQNAAAGVERVYGIRDYDAELAYWSIPTSISLDPTPVYPDRLLVYNYRNGSWSHWDDSITAFGYINFNNALVWQQMTTFTWEQWVRPWGTGANQPRMLRVVGGNQEGFTFFMTRQRARNSPSLQVTQITIVGAGLINLTIVDHNLKGGDHILLEFIEGTADIPNMNGVIYEVLVALTDSIVQIFDGTVVAGAYTGAGTASRVSRIQCKTKQYNFFLESGRNFAMDQIDFLVSKTPGAFFDVETYPSTSAFRTQRFTVETFAYPNNIYPMEQFQDLVWHTIYPDEFGSFIQLNIQYNLDQMVDINTALADFQLHATIYHALPTAVRLQ